MIWRARLVVPVLVVLAAAAGLMNWLFTQTSDKGSRSRAAVASSHPVFGEIHEASATDSFELPDVRGPSGSLLPKTPVSLVVGHHLLGWGGADLRPKMKSGYVSFWDPKGVWDLNGNIQVSNVWAFAACKKSNLIDVTTNDLRAVFCAGGENDKGKSCFGTNWMDFKGNNAIRVREGEVILARHTGEPSKIYAVEMTGQERGHLQARYVEIGQ
jgi:hypothetical protein